MKYVNILPSDTLSDLTERFGVNQVDQILADNGLKRSPNVGQQWLEKVTSKIQTEPEVTSTRKLSILSQFSQDSDIYEAAALATSDTWKVIASLNAFPDYLYVSDQLQDQIPDTFQTLGNQISVVKTIQNIVNSAIKAGDDVDPNIFSNISTMNNVGLVTGGRTASESINPLNWFNIPLDKITLYSSLTGDSINIPAYPEEYVDGRVANYTTMPDLLYQYEPWQMYQSSGPRSNTISFHLHRDMWSGNHLDGRANELIRFCQAQCYPVYNGSAVVTPTVTLYVAGSPLISGVMTNVDVTWTGPIGLDDWYLEFTLALTITEVSTVQLDHATVRNMGLIG